MIKSLFRWPHGLSHRLGIHRSIAKKISLGYALALGTSVLGTSVGLLGGYYEARPARTEAEHKLEKKQLLTNLNNYFLSIQVHPQRLLAIAGESSIWVEYETNQFHTEVRQLRSLLEDIEQLTNEAANPNPRMLTWLNDYKQSLLTYETFIQQLWSDLDGVNNRQDALQIIDVALSSREGTQQSTAFEQLSEGLTRLQQTVDQQYSQSVIRLRKAEQLQLMLILSSMVVSIAIAIALSWVTSRAIAKPVEQLTRVAQQVTKDNNFQLQAAVQTHDEVFLLAKALNQLVSWAGQYTQDLEEARQTLEDRVAERTEALQESEQCLRQQAEDLQTTLGELQRTQLQLVQSEKMSGLGQLVAGIAHEINNPVNFIHGNMQHAIAYFEDVTQLISLYQKHYPEPNAEIQTIAEEIDFPFLKKDFPKLIQSMQDGSRRIREIVTSLRTFSRLDEAVIKQVNIHDGLDSTLTILNGRLKPTLDSPGIQVLRNYGKLPNIECYAGQLNQVFMNILVNAIDALESYPPDEKATIDITTSVLNEDWIIIDIKDNGPGMTDGMHNRLFDPFYTTKPVGKGTGLGLSISYQIITETHSGHITCESSPGKGARFTIQLPTTNG
ncbi:MAG: ATP-binding protein [Cyanobacteria bacterium J06642_11]